MKEGAGSLICTSRNSKIGEAQQCAACPHGSPRKYTCIRIISQQKKAKMTSANITPSNKATELILQITHHNLQCYSFQVFLITRKPASTNNLKPTRKLQEHIGPAPEVGKGQRIVHTNVTYLKYKSLAVVFLGNRGRKHLDHEISFCYAFITSKEFSLSQTTNFNRKKISRRNENEPMKNQRLQCHRNIIHASLTQALRQVCRFEKEHAPSKFLHCLINNAPLQPSP